MQIVFGKTNRRGSECVEQRGEVDRSRLHNGAMTSRECAQRRSRNLRVESVEQLTDPQQHCATWTRRCAGARIQAPYSDRIGEPLETVVARDVDHVGIAARPVDAQ
ncbi:MAG: hypothetical protein EBX81_01675 [bacterium]|nr:hypothetical protein [Candidatus Aquidulcis sp.]